MLDSIQIMNGLAPAYKAFWGFSSVVCLLPLLNIVFAKLNFIRHRDTKIEMFMEWATLFLLFFIVFQWHVVFGVILKAGDAAEAVFLNYVQASEIYSHLKTEDNETSGSIVLKLYKRFEVYGDTQFSVEHYKNKQSTMEQLIERNAIKIEGLETEKKSLETNPKTRSESINDIVKSSLVGLGINPNLSDETRQLKINELARDIELLKNKNKQYLEKTSELLTIIQAKQSNSGSIDEAISDSEKEKGMFGIVKMAIKMGLVHVIVWIASMAKEIMNTLRDGLIMIFFLLGPLIISFSYMFFLGDTDDKGGLNKRTRNFINMVVLLALFPFLYAVLDQIIQIMFYMYASSGRLYSMTDIIGFFIFYGVLYVSFPFFIYNLNPAGMIGGVFSTLSSLQMSTAVLGVGGLTNLSKTGINVSKGVTKSLKETIASNLKGESV